MSNPEFSPNVKSQTVVDDIQHVDPPRIRQWLQQETQFHQNNSEHAKEARESILQVQELLDLVEEAGFLNQVRDARISMSVDTMG